MTSPTPSDRSLRAHVRELELLQALSTDVVRARAPWEIYERALDAVVEALVVDRASLLLLDEAGVMRFAAWRGLSDGYRAAVEGHSPWAADEREPVAVTVPDAELEPSLAPLRETLAKEGIRGLAFIPLVAEHRLLGKFMAYSSQPREFAPHELSLAQMVANHVAVTLERRRQEEILLERERHLEKTVAALKEQNRRKTQFLAMLGHELRNPLAAIRSATEALSAVEPVDPRQERLVGVLDRQSTHMGRLIDGLLEVSRLSRGKVQLDCRPLDLVTLVREVLADRGGLWIERGLTLEAELDPGDLVWVRGDPVRLIQVLDNLLSNAVKFTEPPGTIRVAVGCEGDDALVRISDTGIGIEPELVERLFEPFHQASQNLDRAAGGLGLGLALVKGLVELHGGRVSAASDGPGMGTELIVRLPAVAPPEVAARPDRRAPGRSLAILVVEDNRDTAEALQLLLEGAGHEVAIAYDGEQGLDAALRLQPDVVLCDIGLPGELSGYDVAQRLKSVEDGYSPRLIAITGYGRRADRQRSFDSGFDEHLTKPVTLQRIHQVLAELTE